MSEYKSTNLNHGLIKNQLQQILTGQVGKVAWELHLLNLEWESIVGKRAYHNCKPGKISNETLWIAVKSSVWMQELSYQKEPIIEKINKTLQNMEIKDLRWVQWQSTHEPPQATTYSPANMPVDPDKAEKFARMSKVVSDKNCRQALFELWESFQKNKKTL